MSHRKFPKYKIARVLQRQIVRLTQAFADITTFADLTTSFVLLLLSSAYFIEPQLNV